MKIRIYYIIISGLLIFFASCKKDNYGAPGSTLKGRIAYNGDPINVQYDQVNFELWQPGFGKLAPINVTISQDGSYSALLFDGNYKLVFSDGQGPFMWKKNAQGNPDTLAVTVKGDQTLDLEVTPYYMVRNTSFSASAGKVSASCKLEKIITDINAKNIERVTLYINKTQFVSGSDYISLTDLDGSAITDLNSISLIADIPAITPTQNYVFARVGVKISGVEDMLFSDVVKVQL